MGDNNLYFEVGDRIKVEEAYYSVQGIINFYNSADDYKWTEYKIKSLSNGCIRWLSIDTTYDEYAIYEQYRYSKEFNESELIANGFKESDYGNARVSAFSGDVDVDTGDMVRFREFEDSTEEKIRAIEIWEDETEYSKGYYLDENEIKNIGNDSRSNGNLGNSNSNIKNQGNREYGARKDKSVAIALLALIAVIILFVVGIKSISSSKATAISKFISKDSNFTYMTSITSDLDSTQKADVYSTTLTIESATKAIIDKVSKQIQDVQENPEDNSVAIMTEDEYCLVYTSETGETLVQVSTRLYAYSSSNKPYRSHYGTSGFYRRYYYTRGYTSDTGRYSANTNAYENYSDGTINTNANDKYKNYSDSVRQSSTGSRSSSGGGTSSGK